MSLRLIVMRHAKSSWDDGGIQDHERPLNRRGRQSAKVMGDWLAERDAIPDEVICSTATRTRETWEIASAGWNKAPEPRFERKLYLAPPQDMLRIVQGASGQTVLVIGHNPGCALFAGAMAEERPDHPRFDTYPTAATTILDLVVPSWDRADWGTGVVAGFSVPRDLASFED